MKIYTAFNKYKVFSIILLVAFVVSICAVKNAIVHTKYQLRILSKIIPGTTGILVLDEDGQEIFLDVQDRVIAGTIIKRGVWEPHVRNLIKQIVQPGQRVIVLGAHVGVHTVLMSRLVGEKGQIYVFEPNPSTLKYLKANILFNPIKNITLYEKAAFSANTELKFIAVGRDVNSGASHIVREDKEFLGEEITVQAVKLDSVLPTVDGGFDVLQMDVEGAEAQAVFGAEHIIDNSPNLVVLQEWSPNWMRTDVEKYLKFWRDRGYRFAKITADQLIEISDDELKNSPQIDIIISKNLDQVMTNFKPLAH